MALLTTLPLLAAGAPQFFDSADYATRITTTTNGILDRVAPPGCVPLDVVHVFGSAKERGVAHGKLLSTRVMHFVNVDLPNFYVSEVAGLADNKWLPKWLQANIRNIANKDAPKAFELALGWLQGVQHKYNEASAAAIFDELDGVAEGVCDEAVAAGTACDVAELTKTLRNVNVLPDLIRMQCSMLGAWGSATPMGTLLQLRSLDFGGGPFANNSILIVHHPPAMPDGTSQSFASLSWPGFAGAVTGFNPTLSLSEKVNDVTGGPKPKGTYHGQTTALVLRDVLQFAQANEASAVGAKEKAAAIMRGANRTWGVWIGVGDAHSEQMDVVKYEEASAVTYNTTTLPSLTSQPAVADVVYVDKHPQPSPDKVMPDAVKALAAASNITAHSVAALGEETQSGDVHIAIYDYRPSKGCGRRLFSVYLALGSTDANGTFHGPGGRYAWAAPYVRFEAGDLFSQMPPGSDAKAAVVEELSCA